MRGLRTQESSKFEAFFSIVQDVAGKDGKVFFLDAGDGNEFDNNDMEGENMFGWLVPEDKADKFEEEFQDFADLSEWDDFYVSASCNFTELLEIVFA